MEMPAQALNLEKKVDPTVGPPRGVGECSLHDVLHVGIAVHIEDTVLGNVLLV